MRSRWTVAVVALLVAVALVSCSSSTPAPTPALGAELADKVTIDGGTDLAFTE